MATANTNKHYPFRHKGLEVVKYSVYVEGAGTSTPTTKAGGENMTIARTGVGIWTVTFTNVPVTYRGGQAQVGADTAGDVSDYSVILSDIASGVVTVTIEDDSTGTPAPVDLAANQYVRLEFEFSKISEG